MGNVPPIWTGSFGQLGYLSHQNEAGGLRGARARQGNPGWKEVIPSPSEPDFSSDATRHLQLRTASTGSMVIRLFGI